MWTIARYLPTSLFSLRPALATASGAQSLIVPTPYAVKMALVDVAIRLFGVERGASWWPAIRSLEVAVALPEVIVVNKTFIKIQRPTRVTKSNPAEIEEALAAGVYPMGPTIAFREFVQFGGEVRLAVQGIGASDLPLDRLLAQVNYLGKRGGFWQIQAPPITMEALDSEWSLLTGATSGFAINGTLQMLDDCGPKLTWEHVNIFTGKSIKLGGEERMLRTIVLPYQLRRSSYRYSLYAKIT